MLIEKIYDTTNSNKLTITKNKEHVRMKFAKDNSREDDKFVEASFFCIVDNISYINQTVRGKMSTKSMLKRKPFALYTNNKELSMTVVY